MKLNTFVKILVPALILLSCTREATLEQRKPTDKVAMVSFGFYKDDNPDMILKDYVITNLKSGSNTIFLPEEVEKSKLKARFTVSDGNVVKVGNVIQQSGQTQNDFSIPVDYFISGKDYNAKYTITIGKSFIWNPVSFTYNDSAVDINMKINPVTGEPYIMYYESRASSTEQGASMVAYQEGQWKSLGKISDGRTASNIDFTFNSNGVPYASFVDYTATVAQAATVKKFNSGTSWDLVGNKGLTTTRVTYNTLTFNTDAKLMLVTMMDAAGVLARREAGVSIFENNAWTTNGKITGRPSNLVSWYLTAKTKNGITYLGVINSGAPQTISVYKYENNIWTTLVEQWRDPNATLIHVSGDFDIEADDDGNVYIALADNSNTAVYQHRVVKYSAATKTLSPIGSYIAGASGGSFDFDLAISPLGTPYFFYRASTNYPSLVYLDKETQDWTAPHVFETETATDLNLDFAPNGNAYAAYLKGRKIFVHQYVAP